MTEITKLVKQQKSGHGMHGDMNGWKGLQIACTNHFICCPSSQMNHLRNRSNRPGQIILTLLGLQAFFPKSGQWLAKTKAREDKRRKEALLPPPPIIACKRQVSAEAEITELVKRQKKQARNAGRTHEHGGAPSINYVCSEGWPKSRSRVKVLKQGHH